MNSYNSELLQSAFPDLYEAPAADRPFEGTAAFVGCFPFECGDGWASLIYDLSAALSFHARAHGLSIVATQVKEKYGALRFYVDVADEWSYQLIDEAEEASEGICELCGSQGSLERTGWWTTRCKDCSESSRPP